MVSQATATAGRPGTPLEWALAQLHGDWEDDLIYKRERFRLTDWNSVPVNSRVYSMQLSVMSHHGPVR